MKTYANGMKTTEFTRKQISVLYSKAKKNELKVEKWFMSELYDLADYYNYDYNGSVEMTERFILKIIEKMFAGEIEECQKRIDDLAERTYNLKTQKYQEKIDRTKMVA